MLKILKGILGLTLIFVIIGTGLYVSANRGWLPANVATQVRAQVTTVSREMGNFYKWVSSGFNKDSLANLPEISNPLPQSAQDQMTILAEKSSQSGAVLGSFIQAEKQATDSDKALHERALEYGQYMYCKQVVEVWEREGK